MQYMLHLIIRDHHFVCYDIARDTSIDIAVNFSNSMHVHTFFRNNYPMLRCISVINTVIIPFVSCLERVTYFKTDDNIMPGFIAFFFFFK